ncbi:hypothetical protein H4R35_006950 [Dimargaris xerosporica]|nr:hypothetical protein H4R35_006950 [Dimargaris xerosporica]
MTDKQRKDLQPQIDQLRQTSTELAPLARNVIGTIEGIIGGSIYDSPSTDING